MKQKRSWDFEWEQESLEEVFSCPACGGKKNELLLDKLVDNAFFVAPGKWNLFQCHDCKSAFLNPRPSEKTIHRAYGVYYTHGSNVGGQDAPHDLPALKKVLKMCANGYYNQYFGTHRRPEIRFGSYMFRLYPGFHNAVKARFRYLPLPKPGQKLLDVGCGNGDFLALASGAGWDVRGLEPDLKAFEIAKSRGFGVVQGGVERLANKSAYYDAITISHVIEHVHDPRMLLKTVFDLLKPEGVLYVETPNIDSYGAKTYGRNWRGLEVPRHLVIFSKTGLLKIIKELGFKEVEFKVRRNVRADMALKSYRMQMGISPYDKTIERLPLIERLKLLMSWSIGSEFLTVLAKKP